MHKYPIDYTDKMTETTHTHIGRQVFTVGHSGPMKKWPKLSDHLA